ncbi:hypothetical protein SAMN05720766_1325 [Fibrobacter sp. UWH9]|uniref:hypothetical protein n=1 Tax=unclassified Fibrobacter TaxID=2634177 RepID=UPI0009162644|nr:MULTISPECIES: hypothetical protein [Fibrobacter]MCQ2101345.1 hypothetical protein [Fibrobacter sp.]MCL4103240.1 hypothetical protein [Fibrobacter succinogenes]SHH87625.1 hypothetical protein SAMN05720766_1325 [Fibrobacter sp. UWH9]SHK99785.1 hypothetical protein SAMN05720765_107125 [Fibrobacter sp. UWH6]SHL83954.1 hypothetical protein SAMN05720764_12628 [Fibrobacter sp. UWH5]
MSLEQKLNIREKKGAEAKNKELAKDFRDAGISLEVIAQQTGLSPEEIKTL